MQPTKLEGKVNTKRRAFHQVVADLKNAVYSVIRIRPDAGGTTAQATALGSGFFVSPDVFMTCAHVLNPAENPHRDGDAYQLVNQYAMHTLGSGKLGDTIHLFPDKDLGILLLKWKKQQLHVALEYGDVPQGVEIGISGYPLPVLFGDGSGKPVYDGLIHRVGRGVVTATYKTTINSGAVVIPNATIFEVNFLFVPGNSGGPIFDVETGRVCGYVHGYRANTINQRIQKVDTKIKPAGMADDYVESLHAVYSIGIKLDGIRSQLESFGVTL